MRRPPHRHALAFDQREMRLAVAMERGTGSAFERERDRRGVGDRDRPVGEGVRRHGHQRERGDLGIENGAAGRQRVGGRSGRCRDDDAVRPHRVDEAAVDLDRAIDHRAAAAAIQHDVVERERGFARAVGAHDLGREQRAALLDVAARQHGVERLFRARDGNVGEEAQAPLIDADQRHVERRESPRDREHRAVAADDDRDVRAGRERFRRRRGIGRDTRGSRGFGVDHHVVTPRGEKRREARQRLGDAGAHVASDQRHPAESRGGHRWRGGRYHRPD